jgi:glycosyltransferase involved in cell wall biosynthesis
MKKQITNLNRINGKKHIIQNIGKTSAVINYTKWGSGLLVRNQPIGPGRTVTVQYQSGSFYSATMTQLKTISITDLPEQTPKTTVVPPPIQNPQVLHVQEQPETKDFSKILISTLDTTRYDILEKFILYYQKFGFDILVVGNDENKKNLSEYLESHYVSVESEPIGSYLNSQIDFFQKNPKYSHILLLESDTFLDENVISQIFQQKNKYKILAWNDFVLVNDYGEIVYIKPKTNGRPIPQVRLVSREIISELRGQLWDTFFGTSANINSWSRLERFKSKKIISFTESNGLILQIDPAPDTRNYKNLIKNGEANHPSETQKKKTQKICNNIDFSFFEKKLLDIKKDVVSIIITNFNTSEFLENAIQSSLNQTYSEIEIIILDDNSTDDSHIVLEKYKNYPNIHIYLYNQNMGPYWLKNSILDKISGDYVTILDSDDIDSPEKIEKQLTILKENPNISCVTCQYERIGHKVSLGYPSMMWRKTVFNKIGYYDSVKMGADSEFYERFLKVYGKSAVHHITEVLQKGVRRENGLTSIIPERSTLRNKYLSNFFNWHKTTRDPYLPFPLESRPFQVPSEMMIQNEQKLYEIKKLPNENDKLPVIMCVWKRIDGFEKIINQLNGQTYKNFKLFVWNNNIELKDGFEKLLQVHADFDYEIHHSEKNIGGFGRFYYGQKIRRRPELMDYCVFIDDDQTFGNEILEVFYKERESKTIKSQYGWKFSGLNYYVNRVQKKPGEELHYAGTGGMIMDMSILEDPNLYKCKDNYWFVEDLWLSFFSNKIHGYKVSKSSAIIKNGDDQHSLYKRVKDLKTPMLNYLVKEENWNIL